MKILNDFRQFLLRGNVVDLAVAVVIGAAFGAVITALVEDLLTPLIAAIGGQQDFSALDFTINDSTLVRRFHQQGVTFVTIAAIYFFVVVPIMHSSRSRREPPADPTTQVRVPRDPHRGPPLRVLYTSGSRY
jgi:large conductance mechanosensitive channel